nr:MAG TPA: hypothetical protein [Caudoviricetes sp.]
MPIMILRENRTCTKSRISTKTTACPYFFVVIVCLVPTENCRTERKP